MTDHAELRRLAGEAIGRSESEWYVVRGLSHVRDGEDNFICDTCEDEPILASYVATANPKTVLALLDEIDRLKAENDRMRQGMKGDYDIDAWLGWSKEKERIKVENEELRGALQAVVDDPTWRSNDNTLWPKIIKAMDKGATK
ncbi:TPA: ead/Ea22-like family protein [Pseudomonas aeruginosa]|nr:ead/Ea22-like family protein [Pseudomonas aeruginosa]